MINLIQFHLHTQHLILDLRKRGLKMKPKDTDVGYLIHSWIMQTFGENPFFCFDFNTKNPRSTQVLAYTKYNAVELFDLGQKYLGDEFKTATLAVNWQKFSSKALPNIWPVGHRLQFQTQVCPVVRPRNKEGKQKEMDAFLHKISQVSSEIPINRNEVYCDWFQHKMKARSAVSILSCSITKFRLQPMLRKKQLNDNVKKRVSKNLLLPVCNIVGTLEIEDSEAFNLLLQQGTSRHKSFGFGMLLLSPSKG